VKLLQHLAIKARCSVAILAHPSNAGMATGSGLSGSTGWHNKVRSRLYMRSPTTAKGEEIDSDVREIQFLKNNYGRQGDSIQIRWEGGVFVPESAPASFERIARDRDDDHRFLDLLAKYEGQGRKLSHKAAAKDYAPRVFTAEKGSIGLKRFEQAMERLFERAEIHVAAHGPASRGWSHIARGVKEPAE
jgi:RecA-family ATPase